MLEEGRDLYINYALGEFTKCNEEVSAGRVYTRLYKINYNV